jgi:large subunit ribosomal protein L24
MTLHIKTGDEVVILAGKYKGKRGKVQQVFPKLNRVVVEGVNLMKRHMKSRGQGQPGQVVDFPMPIHASNVKAAGAEATPKAKKAKAS